jgi:hypothetical protein
MDPVREKFDQIRWYYADKDPDARAELARRIRERARRGEESEPLTYSELVEGVVFRLPNVNGGVPFQLGMPEWTELDRKILGEFLGYISKESYEEGGIIASALVVSKTTSKPSEGFRALMRQVGLLRGSKSDDATLLWVSELRKAQDWYKTR